MRSRSYFLCLCLFPLNNHVVISICTTIPLDKVVANTPARQDAPLPIPHNRLRRHFRHLPRVMAFLPRARTPLRPAHDLPPRSRLHERQLRSILGTLLLRHDMVDLCGPAEFTVDHGDDMVLHGVRGGHPGSEGFRSGGLEERRGGR